MLCPRCHGKGYLLDWMGREKCRCPNPDCHAGQVSCSEGSERTGGVEDIEQHEKFTQIS